LIGDAVGAKTLKSPEKEVGVFPITLTEEGLSDPLFYDFPLSFLSFIGIMICLEKLRMRSF